MLPHVAVWVAASATVGGLAMLLIPVARARWRVGVAGGAALVLSGFALPLASGLSDWWGSLLSSALCVLGGLMVGNGWRARPRGGDGSSATRT